MKTRGRKAACRSQAVFRSAYKSDRSEKNIRHSDVERTFWWP